MKNETVTYNGANKMKCWYCEHDGSPEFAYNVCQTHYAQGKKITPELREQWRRDFYSSRYAKMKAKLAPEGDIFGKEKAEIF
jgi:hypothetical protein